MNFKFSIKLTACLLCLVLTFSGHPSIIDTSVTKAATLSYNTGIRDQAAANLSNDAIQYYQGSYSDSVLSQLNGSTLKNSLYSLMSSTMKNSVSYYSLPSYWKYSDAEDGKAGTVLFYSDEDSSYFNREHVWPKSRGSFYQSNGGCDLHHLRPTDVAVNSSRGNYTMGDLNHSGTAVTYNGKTVGWYNDALDLFEPLDNVKGDVARIFLYMYVRWQQPNLYEDVPKSSLPVLDPDDTSDTGEAVIENLDTLLNWMISDPVDTWEMSRNDIVEDVQGNRNVFIDHPEYAWKIFNKTVPANVTVLKAEKQNVYQLVTSIEDIKSGCQYVLVGKNGTKTKALSNKISGGCMKGTNVTIRNSTIINPDKSIVWTLKKHSKSTQFSIYSKSAKKYLVINKNSARGFSLTKKPSSYFNASSASKKAGHVIYLTTTSTGKRKISLYNTDFRSFKTKDCKPLYLYKLVS